MQKMTIKKMPSHEIILATLWANKEGWNAGLNDASLYPLADKNGFFIGLIEEEPIAIISAVKYNADFGFIGFYIVKASHRGKGYGIQMWNTALAYLKDCNIALDAVVSHQEKYKKAGFSFAYKNMRYEGYGTAKCIRDTAIVKLSSLGFNTIASYDRAFFPAPRDSFLKAWISHKYAYGYIKDAKLQGYTVMRPCKEGYKIAPLYADTLEIAQILLDTLKSKIKSTDKIYLDIPQPNKNALDLVGENNMKMVFETARMYTKKPPKIALDRLYGITSFEIG